MDYPENKTQFIKFLKQNPGIYYKVTRPDGSKHLRKLSRPQTNAFAGHGINGKESWFYFEKGDIYTFENSKFITECSFGRLVFDFNPPIEEIKEFETQRKEAAA